MREDMKILVAGLVFAVLFIAWFAAVIAFPPHRVEKFGGHPLCKMHTFVESNHRCFALVCDSGGFVAPSLSCDWELESNRQP
jgi:hypothetical protein